MTTKIFDKEFKIMLDGEDITDHVTDMQIHQGPMSTTWAIDMDTDVFAPPGINGSPAGPPWTNEADQSRQGARLDAAAKEMIALEGNSTHG